MRRDIARLNDVGDIVTFGTAIALPVAIYSFQQKINDIEHLTKRMAGLEDMESIVKSMNVTTSSQTEALEGALKKLSASVDKLEERAISSESQSTSLEGTMERLSGSVNQLEERVSSGDSPQLQEFATDMQQALAAYQEMYKELTNNVENLAGKEERRASFEQALVQSIKVMEDRLGTQVKTLEQRTKETDEMEGRFIQRLEDVREAIMTSLEEGAKGDPSVSNKLLADVALIKKEMAADKKDSIQAATTVKKLESAIDTLSVELSTQQKEAAARLEERLQAISADVDDASEQQSGVLQSLVDKLVQVERDVLAVTEANTAMQEQLDGATTELAAQLNKRSDETTALLRDAIDRKEGDLEDRLLRATQALENQISQVTKDADSRAQQMADALEARVTSDELDNQLSRVSREVDSRSKEVATAVAQQMTDALGSKVVNGLEELGTVVDTQLAATKASTVEAVAGLREDVFARAVKLEEESVQLSREVENLGEQLAARTNSLSEELGRARDETALATQEVKDSFRGQLSESVGAMEKQLEKRVSKLRSTFAKTVEARADELAADIESARLSAIRSEDRVQETVRTLSSNLEQVDSRSGEALDVSAQAMRQVNKAKGVIEKRASAINETLVEVEGRLKGELVTLESRGVSLEKSLTSRTEALTRGIADAESRFEGDLSVQRETSEALKRKLLEAETRLEAEIHALNAKEALLQETLVSRADALVRDIASTESRLAGSLSDQSAASVTLKHELETAQAELASVKDQVKELRNARMGARVRRLARAAREGTYRGADVVLRGSQRGIGTVADVSKRGAIATRETAVRGAKGVKNVTVRGIKAVRSGTGSGVFAVRRGISSGWQWASSKFNRRR